MANFNIATGAGIYFAEDMGAKGDGSTDDAPAIQAAINAISAAGGGTLQFGAREYALGAKLVANHNVRLQGVGGARNDSTGVSGGTVFLAKTAGAYAGIAWNDAPLSAQPPASGAGSVPALALYGFHVTDIGFVDFTRPVHIGDKFNSGFRYSSLKNLWTSGATDWGFWLENCGEFWGASNLRATNSPASATGGIMIATSQTNFNNGNAVLNNTFCENTVAGGLSRGLVIRATDDAIMNNLVFERPQSNLHGNVVSQTATTTSGSADIVVTDGTQFPLDMPVAVATQFDVMKPYQLYFVVSQVGNTIQIAFEQAGTPLVLGTTGTPSLIRWGFPSIEVVGYGGSTNIQPVFLSGTDAEGMAGCSVYGQRASIILSLGAAGSVQGTEIASTICARSLSGGSFSATSAILDFDANSTKAAFVNVYRQSTHAYPYPSGPLIGTSYNANKSRGEIILMPHGAVEVTGSQYATSLPRSVLQPVRLITASIATVSLYGGGVYSCIYTGTLTTIKLPALVASLQTAFVTTQGLPLDIINDMPTSGATMTVNTNAADNFSNSTKTSYSIPQGGSLRLLGNTDGTNTWWSVVANNGAT